jgi:hypothetical protein
MRVVLLFLLLINILNADNSTDTNSNYSKKLYIKVTNTPKQLFFNQRFAVSYKILITDTQYSDYDIKFIPNKSVEMLNPNSPWTKENNNTLINTFYFKAKSKRVKIPNLTASFYESNELIDSAKSDDMYYRTKKIAVNSQYFCNVIAKKINVLDTIIKQSDNKYAIAVFEIEAYNANLEDFVIKTYHEENSIESYDDELEYQKIFYYVKIPISTSRVSFDYFNIETKQFQKVNIPINIKEILSTQADLNPEQSNLNAFKKMVLVSLIVLFIILYFIYRKRVLLVFVLIFLGFILYLLIPLKTMIVSKGTPVQILPTKKSTIFKTLTKDEEVKILSQNENYIKIIMPNNNIGWVKKSLIKRKK